MTRTLLTGATGFLGSYLLRDALVAGRAVAVLVRPERESTAQERVDALLDRFEEEVGERLPAPTVLEGDLHRPDLGLDEAARSWIAENCDRLLHCAASLAFHAKGGEPYRSNVDGTRYALALCQDTGIRNFHLVSTAYVCGRRHGRVLERELECGQEFSSDYERSKFMSEVLVHRSPALERWTVYRPSVIVGDSATGFTSGHDGLYAFLRLARLSDGRQRDEVLERVGIGIHDGLNLVPVDWVSAAVTHLLGKPDGPEPVTYHLTNPTPLTPAELFDAAAPLARTAAPVPMHALDEVLRVYGPYLRNHAEFDRTHLVREAPDHPCPTLDRALLERLIGYVADRERKASRNPNRMELALSVAGADEATFDLSAPDQARLIAPREAEEARVRATCSSLTYDRLVDRELSVEDAIYGGLLALEGEPARLVRATELVEAYLHEERHRLALPEPWGAS